MTSSELPGQGAPQEKLSPLPKDRKIIILPQRQYHVLNLRAQGLSLEEIKDKLLIALGTGRKDSSSAITTLGADNLTHAVLMGMDLGIVERAPLLRGNENIFEKFAPKEIQIMKAALNNNTTNCDVLADKLFNSPSTIKKYLSIIMIKTDTKTSTHAAAVYKAVLTKNQPPAEDTLVYIEEDRNNRRRNTQPFLTEADIRLFDLLIQKVSLDEIEQQPGQLAKIRDFIGTPARLIAMVKGLKKGKILLPPRTEAKELPPGFFDENTHLATTLFANR